MQDLMQMKEDIQGSARVQSLQQLSATQLSESVRSPLAPGETAQLKIGIAGTLAHGDRVAGQNNAMEDHGSSAAESPSSSPCGCSSKQGAAEPKQEKRPAQKKSNGVEQTAPVQLEEKPAPAPNRTGLPDQLKTGVENISGLSLDDVKVHYNSAHPAQLNALAYAQGTDIHVAPGQEKHLPHEAWHVVQQKEGRVRPTMQMKQGVPVNDDRGLETEADVMGAKALSSTRESISTRQELATSRQEMPLQRRLTVENIDYNPQTGEYRHGFIQQANFLTALRDEINGQVRWVNFRGQVNNVLNAVRDTANQDEGGLRYPDIPSLADRVTTEVINEYGARGLAAMGAQRAHLEPVIVRLLAANIQADVGAGVAMNAQEGNAYDGLRAIVTDARMSRAKGVANPLPYDRVGGALKGAVDTVLTGIRNERAYWRGIGIRNLHISNFLPPPNEEFNVAVRNSQRLSHYQGNHTNLAGWLPAAAAPASPLNQQQNNILGAATPGLNAILLAGAPLTALGIQKGAAPTALGQEFITLVRAARQAITNDNLVISIGSALAQDISAYVEFSMPTDISRLVYDTVNGHAYVSAHYKWRAGYNPWFQITGFPAV